MLSCGLLCFFIACPEFDDVKADNARQQFVPILSVEEMRVKLVALGVERMQAIAQLKRERDFDNDKKEEKEQKRRHEEIRESTTELKRLAKIGNDLSLTYESLTLQEKEAVVEKLEALNAEADAVREKRDKNTEWLNSPKRLWNALREDPKILKTEQKQSVLSGQYWAAIDAKAAKK